MADFSDKIKDWVVLDNRVKKLNDEIKEIRANRNKLGDSIYTYAVDNNLDHAVIQISDGKIKFQNTRVAQPLTLKLIKECLHDCIGNNEELVNTIIQHIRDKREIRYVNDLKRYYS